MLGTLLAQASHAQAITAPPLVDASVGEPALTNEVSLFSARSLGAGRGGIEMSLGFPLVGTRLAVGVLPTVDLGAGFDTFFGLMNEARVLAKWQLTRGNPLSFALAIEGGRAFFVRGPSVEGRGARWITGRRDWNLDPGLIVSYALTNARRTRLFLDTRYSFAFDTEPYVHDPLSGLPPDVQVSGNFRLRVGSEIPFSDLSSFVLSFGLDLHGRPDDSPFMLALNVGLVTAL